MCREQRLTLAGVGFALLAALGWAFYILLSAQTGRRWPGITGLAIASVVGAIASHRRQSSRLAAGCSTRQSLRSGVAVGLLSSVIPYSFELIALRRIPPRVFSILMSLEPAAAALAAMIVLGEFLTLGAVARHGLRGDRQHRRNSYVDDFGSAEAPD